MRRRRAGPILFVAAFVIVVLYRIIVFGRALYWGDLLLYFYPLNQVIRNSLLAGRLPLWNPYVNCGQPLLGNPQSSVFYPTTTLLLWLPVWYQYTVVVALHLFAAGLGTYLYLRRLTSDRLSATLGAVLFAGSGYLVARLQFPTMVQACAYLPWVLLLADRMVERPRLWYGALLALCIACLALAGHAQVAYMTLAAGSMYALIRLWPIRRHRSRVRRSLAAMSAAVLLGVLCASVQLLPTVQLFDESTRERLTWRDSNRFVMLPEHLLNFVFPSFYGSPARGDYWGSGNAWEPCVYIGLLPLALGAYAIARAWRRRAVRYYAFLALVSLWLALGRYGGLFWIAYYVVPGIASFHDPARFTFLTTFALAVLAALGLRKLRDQGLPNGIRAAIVLVSTANLAWFSSGLNPTANPSQLMAGPELATPAGLEGNGRIYSALHDDVWKRLVNYADYQPDNPHYTQALTNALVPNIGMRFGVEEASGYEPVPVRTVTEVDGLIRQAIQRQSPNLTGLLGLFHVRLLTLPVGIRFPHPALKRSAGTGAAAYELRDPMPQAWLVRRTVRVDGAQRSLAAISEPQFDMRSLAVVSDAAGLDESRSSLGEQQQPVEPVIGARETMSGFAVDVNAGPAPAFLVRSEAFYPGWRARVDGRRSIIVRADHALQGVVVPPGRHVVDFRYEPFVALLGLYITLVSGCGVTSALVYGAIVRPHVRRAGSLPRSVDGSQAHGE